jgi:hypothetical protein
MSAPGGPDDMETVGDFEDLLERLEACGVEYLVVGGLAFIYHAKPRYTKDMDVWVRPSPENVERVNRALAEFGSPSLLDPREAGHILQIGVAPHRIDLHLSIKGVRFATAWNNRVRGRYGQVIANWIDLDSLIRAKDAVGGPRHEEDVRVLREVRKLRQRRRRGQGR